MAIAKLPEGNSVKVLVVEDDEIMKGLVTRVLTVMGVQEEYIFQASDGAEGLRVACEQKPSVIICDQQMHPVTGIQLLAGIRHSTDKSIFEIPVIVFTGARDASVANKAKILKVSAYLLKPCKPDFLSIKILEVLGIKPINDNDT